MDQSHSTYVKRGIKFGMCLFILSEVMFFFSFFWSFFHISLSPSPDICCVWPPRDIEIIDPFGIPLLNTIILLSSGVTITISHYFSVKEKIIFDVDIIYSNGKKDRKFLDFTCHSITVIFLILTIVLGLIFTLEQIGEYADAPFSWKDNIYGSLFYLLTGFHGLHVVIGTLFLIVCCYRLIKKRFNTYSNVGYECAIWYWHFVDVVWLFLFVVIYLWGSL